MQLHTSVKPADEENFDKMKLAYDACLNEDKIKALGAEPLLHVLDEIKKLSHNHATETKDIILALAEYGVTALVTSGTGADDTDPDTVVVSVGAPWSFGLPSKERYEDEELVERYRSVAVEVLGAFYPNQSTEAFAGVIDLEKKLAAASPSEEDREDVTVSTVIFEVGAVNANITAEILQPNAYRRGCCNCSRD